MRCMQLMTVNGLNRPREFRLTVFSFFFQLIRFVGSTTIKQTENCLQGDVIGDADDEMKIED